MNYLKKLGIQDENSGACTGVDGWAKAEAKWMESVSPADGSVIAKISTIGEDQIEATIASACQAAAKWQTVPAPQRGDIIRQIGNALRENKDALGSLVSLEMGKSKQEGDGEVQEMIDIADFAVGQSRMLYGKTMHSERPSHRMYEQWHPYGVIGIISAFNFPVAVWAWNAFISAICGNASIWKPSEKTPLCAIAVQHICNTILEKNNCPDIFSFFLPHSPTLTEHLVKDQRVSLISFTGSTQTGKHVARLVSERLGSSILELGGNNAVIIDESADLSLATPAVVFGAVGTAGQRCTSTRRALVHHSIYDKFVHSLKNAYQQISIGDPLDKNNLMGPLIDQASVDRFTDTVRQAIRAGGTIEHGGKALDQAGFYVEPTIISGLSNNSALVQQETFAPILYIMAYQTIDEAIAMQNNVKQGLSSSIFTRELKKAELFLSSQGSDCGIANVNIGTSGAEIGGAFGGEKDTGGGRESGSDAWKAYMRRQTNTINWSDALPLAQGIKFNL